MPYAPQAPWWRLTRHFTPVMRFEAGSSHLEIDTLGRWQPTRAQRDSVLMAFPRAAGSRLRRAIEGGNSPLPIGSLLYEPTGRPSWSGSLFVVRGERQAPGLARCERLHYVQGRSPSTYTRRREPYEMIDVRELWLVNHLGRESSAVGEAQRQPSARRFTFDAARAEAEIQACERRLQHSGATTVEGATPEARDELLADDDTDEADGELRPMSRYAERREGAGPTRVEIQAAGIDDSGRRRLAVDGRPRMTCRYGGIECRGCGARIAFGAPICAGGDGLVHDDGGCLERARRDLEVRASSASASATGAAPTDPTSDLEVGRALATYIELEMEFAMEGGSDRMADCLLPRDSLDVFIAFLRWAVRRGVEGDALSSLWRAGSTLMASTRGRDFTELETVRQTFDEMSTVS